MSTIPNSNDQNAVRTQKLVSLQESGANPYSASVVSPIFSTEAIASYVNEEDNKVTVTVAGRLVTIRDMGKSQFVKIQDQEGIIQLYVKKDVIGDAAYQTFKQIDLGDIIGATGTLFRTKAGEITVRTESYTLVSKALHPLPEKWHGLADPEQIYRQRYLDLLVNTDSRSRLLLRSKIVSYIRRFFEDRKFLEVETPVLQSTEGGAAAKPFKTHHDALDTEFSLRISLELYLKRLLVGGYDRVFEIGRNFRNEGISRKHNPEFTMLEVYQAYSDYQGMQTLVQELILGLIKNVVQPKDEAGNPSLKILHPGSSTQIDFGAPWRSVTYRDLIIEATQDPQWFSKTTIEKVSKVQSLGIAVPSGLQDYEVTNLIFGKLIEPSLIQPTFVTHLPKELCPLAKLNKDDPTVLDVFELIIGGMEVAPAYSEQNDPVVQRQMFAAQAGEETQKIDTDFLLALEHGMPPAGGMGIGIDRLVMLLTSAENIRDVILFPQMRKVS